MDVIDAVSPNQPCQPPIREGGRQLSSHATHCLWRGKTRIVCSNVKHEENAVTEGAALGDEDRNNAAVSQFSSSWDLTVRDTRLQLL